MFAKIIKILTIGGSSEEDTSSEFSRFFRTASSGDKKKVFLRVAREASEDQRKLLEVR